MPVQSIESGVPQGSPVSPILFTFYLGGLFQAIEQAIHGIRALSYEDVIGLLIEANSVRQACQGLEQAARIAIEQGRQQVIQFDTEKN
jgi:retron-type reverse transcriptase